MIFFPSHDMSFFDSHCGLFALILPYFAFFYPFTSPFLIFFPLSSFFFSLSSFFFNILPLFSSPFLFSPPNDIDWYPVPWGGGGAGYFPIYRPLNHSELEMLECVCTYSGPKHKTVSLLSLHVLWHQTKVTLQPEMPVCTFSLFMQISVSAWTACTLG